MSLIRTFRKKKDKIIITCLVIIIIAFVGGSALQQVLLRLGHANDVIATFDDGKKIKQSDMNVAENQLKVLELLGAKHFLLARGIEETLLDQVLFSDETYASSIYNYIKMGVLQGRFAVDMDLLDSFFEDNNSMRATLWILLNNEADSAGIAVSREDAISTLQAYYSQATQQAGDAGKLVATISEKNNIKQEDILDIFARLLSIMKYASLTGANSDVSLPQIDATIAIEKETVSSEFVKFRAKDFTDNIKIDETRLKEQFNKFKDRLPGNYSQDNPYGFGYKLPDRVQLEYMIVKLNDVASTITKPNPEEMESFYEANKNRFVEEVSKDPSNPKSEKTRRVKTFAEVASQVEKMILAQKRNAKAEKIIDDAKSIVEEKLFDKDIEKISADQMKELSGDYATTAKKVSNDYGVTVYYGKTGYLSMDQLATDMQLGMLMKQTSRSGAISLPELAFAVDGLDTVKLGKFSGKAPKLYQDISNLKGAYSGTVAMVRVIDFKKSATPKDINESYPITKAQLTDKEPKEEIFNLRDAVENDCKLVAAMYIAREKAEDLIANAGDDWDKAVDAYNAKAPETAKIKLEKAQDRQRISSTRIEMIKAQSKLMPSQGAYYQYALVNKLAIDKFAELAKSGEAMPFIMNFEPDASVYAIKNISVKEATTADYDELKATVAWTLERSNQINAALSYYNAKNIKARNNYVDLRSKSTDKK